MILLCGIPSEGPLAMVRDELEALNAEYVMLNQREHRHVDIALEVSGGHVGGELRIGGHVHPLERFSGVYNRLIDQGALPDLQGADATSPDWSHCQDLHQTLSSWLEITSARVVNRARPMGSNASKPYQAQLIRDHGFSIPETLLTNDPDCVREFFRAHGRVVFKSTSAVRSIVQLCDEHDLARLERVRWCPVQFQAFVDGTNVRVHVVGQTTIASAIRSDAVDYRYPGHFGDGETELEALELDDELASRCVALVRALQLDFAGVDLKLTPDGDVVCFEVNPSPGFSFYELRTGQPIARTVALHLLGRVH